MVIVRCERRGQGGFTLLELVMVIVIIGILGAVAVRSADLALDRNRYFSTLREMEQLGHAIAGDPELVSARTRADFGYVGDMGSLPTSLDQLVTDQGGTWDGPYVINPLNEDSDAYRTDGWGNTYTYPVSGLKTKISSGGGGTSVTHQFAASEASLTSNAVSGTITDWSGANPTSSDLANITVTVHHPSSGSMTTTSATPSAGGVFSVSGIPVGHHRVVATHSTLADSAVKLITVTPGFGANVDLRFNATLPGTDGSTPPSSGLIEYVTGSASTYGNGKHMRFDIENTGGSSVTVTSLTAVYTTAGYYSRVQWDGTQVWSGSPLQGSGDVTTFSSSQSLDAGASVKIDMKQFKTAPTGGSWADMSGTSFEITFSDSSVITFTAS